MPREQRVSPAFENRETRMDGNCAYTCIVPVLVPAPCRERLLHIVTGHNLIPFIKQGLHRSCEAIPSRMRSRIEWRASFRPVVSGDQ